MDEKNILEEIAEATGGKIEDVTLLPDGHGFATMSFPLPEDHWIYGLEFGDEFENPPMPFRMGTDDPRRKHYTYALRQAGKYAVRAATRNGKDDDFDPDAIIHNLIVGFLGYQTPTGLSDVPQFNP